MAACWTRSQTANTDDDLLDSVSGVVPAPDRTHRTTGLTHLLIHNTATCSGFTAKFHANLYDYCTEVAAISRVKITLKNITKDVK